MKPILFLLLQLVILAYPAIGQGLFPPVDLSVNLASGRPVTATSVCGTGPPSSCNSTCPHGNSFPNGTDVLSVGNVGGGLVSRTFLSLFILF